MDRDELPLGQATEYPKSFSRDLLTRIPRLDAREKLQEAGELVEFNGFDLWTIYELGWISTSGAANLAIGEVRVPADSPHIVESKSLKLYINSLYYRRFHGVEQVQDEISTALTTLLEAPVIVHLWPLADFGSSDQEQSNYVDLDPLQVEATDTVDAYVLQGEKQEGYTRTYKTELFRSLCPVTSQPDWATVFVGLAGFRVEEKSLAAYLHGYREHQAFHENCVEQIYADLNRKLEPDRITVAARFTRRGGIDINPYRTSEAPLFQMPGRTVRQ